MKKRVILFAVLLAAALLLTACSANYVISGSGSKTTVKINAKDGAFAETSDFSVGKDSVAVVEPNLSKGKIQIDFVEVAVFHHDKEPDEIIYGNVVASVTVEGTEKKEVELGANEYVMQLNAIGESSGSLVVNINKK